MITSLRVSLLPIQSERSLEALSRLTSSRSGEVLDALVEAAGQIIAAENGDPNDDEILDEIRSHLVDVKAVGLLTDALKHPEAATREFALTCLSEAGDLDVLPAMITALGDEDEGVRVAAAEHLALLTKFDLGTDPAKWTEWLRRRTAGLVEQAVEELEDKAKMLKVQMRGRNAREEEAAEEPPPPPHHHHYGM